MVYEDINDYSDPNKILDIFKRAIDKKLIDNINQSEQNKERELAGRKMFISSLQAPHFNHPSINIDAKKDDSVFRKGSIDNAANFKKLSKEKEEKLKDAINSLNSDFISHMNAKDTSVQWKKESANTEGSKEKEMVDHPDHYQGHRFEVIDIIEDYKLSFHDGNALKYILRAGKKESDSKDSKASAIQDWKKAIWYLERLIEKNEKD